MEAVLKVVVSKVVGVREYNGSMNVLEARAVVSANVVEVPFKIPPEWT